MKKKLLVSFSGGETSAFMAKWLWDHKRDEYEMLFVFANTGEENEETLQFVNKFSRHFLIPVIWVESHVYNGQRKGTGFKLTNFIHASRDGQPFEDVIKKYGIPNRSFPHCSRELKFAPIHKFIKSLGWKDYYTAIGIRIDEFDRMDKDRDKKRYIYPLINQEMQPMTKKKINFFWSQQPFRLELKGYQGNCQTCWKKSNAKLYTIAKERETAFNFMSKMEDRYSYFTPPTRTECNPPYTFFRGNKSAIQIIKESKDFDGSVINDAELYEEEICDGFSDCEVIAQSN